MKDDKAVVRPLFDELRGASKLPVEKAILFPKYGRENRGFASPFQIHQK